MLSRDDYLAVARIHKDAISEGFLSTLGVNFLALLYESIDRATGCVLIVERADGKIVGFVSGALGLGSVYRIMLRSWVRLFFSLFPALLSPTKLYRIGETVFFSKKSGDVGVELPHHELLSIAVSKEFRGKGHAEQLFRKLISHFHETGVEKFKIVVGDALAPAHRFYCRMGAYPVARAEVHKGSGSIIYVCDVG